MAPLVDYSDSDSDSHTGTGPAAKPPGDDTPLPAKKRRVSSSSASALPPLPPSFHDLYASTVRPSTTDDPSLHQGRRRQIPHLPGHWPSHVYVEWLPPPPAHDTLCGLLSTLEAELPAPAGDGVDEGTGKRLLLHSFLTSDLGASLPLHVSLSRPFVLRTEERAGFLEGLADGVRASGVAPFALACTTLAWHRSPESNRSFLVLRVRSRERDLSREQTEMQAGVEEGGRRAPNAELSVLLARCNRLVVEHNQPALYAGAGAETDGRPIWDAFHISIAWSFAEPTDEVRERTAAVFARSEVRDAVRGIVVDVDCVKAKIGNAVTNIPLKGRGRAAGGDERRRSLFGI
ncbi:U6 snRNA phosphodiesterase [Pleurostoma richardsiae]|uniref:U6 snRNA phosphodiesterase n=1 Tax=Pleurostoma richardsiae TaxID=41990 RepID=A0AA38RNZ7_9PEZI|nr:U6 snRNA phosphodiesterase [Pleurostoma richardsiae]